MTKTCTVCHSEAEYSVRRGGDLMRETSDGLVHVCAEHVERFL